MRSLEKFYIDKWINNQGVPVRVAFLNGERFFEEDDTHWDNDHISFTKEEFVEKLNLAYTQGVIDQLAGRVTENKE